MTQEFLGDLLNAYVTNLYSLYKNISYGKDNYPLSVHY